MPSRLLLDGRSRILRLASLFVDQWIVSFWCGGDFVRDLTDTQWVMECLARLVGAVICLLDPVRNLIHIQRVMVCFARFVDAMICLRGLVNQLNIRQAMVRFACLVGATSRFWGLTRLIHIQ